MAKTSKWIESVSGVGRTSDAARQTLKVRLEMVQHYLPLAAEQAHEDTEHVHQLRVATRRAHAALKLYAGLLPRRRATQLGSQLRSVRRAAGDAREYDVLIARIGQEMTGGAAEQIIERLVEARHVSQRPILNVHRQLQLERFGREFRKLLARVHPRAGKNGSVKDPRFKKWSRAQLRRFVKQFFKAARADLSDRTNLHRFRIRAKQLRYAMELLASAFPPSVGKKLLPQVEQLQDLLGEVNDHATAAEQFRRMMWLSKECREGDLLLTLLQREQDRMEASRLRFQSWWSPKRANKLRSGIAKVLR